MKSFVSTILICFFQISSILPSHCGSVYFPMDAALIDQTCRNTPKYDLCMSSFRHIPESAEADVKGLALIMDGVVLKGEAEKTRTLVNQLMKQGLPIPPLQTCADNYGVIINFDIPEVVRGINTTGGLPAKAELAMDDAVDLVTKCNNGLVGDNYRGTPLIRMNAKVSDLAAITKAIVLHLP